MRILSFALALVLTASGLSLHGCAETSQATTASSTSRLVLQDNMRELWTAQGELIAMNQQTFVIIK